VEIEHFAKCSEKKVSKGKISLKNIVFVKIAGYILKSTDFTLSRGGGFMTEKRGRGNN
jgi:hypothetical protein